MPKSKNDPKDDEQNDENNIQILSWDVGIKNLAYCLIKKSDDKFKIKQWGVINLVENRQKCDFILRTGEQCSELAKACVYHKDKIPLFSDDIPLKYACTRHKEKMIPKLVQHMDISKSKGKSKKSIVTQKIPNCNLCDNASVCYVEGTPHCWCDNHQKKAQSFAKKIGSKRVTVVSCTKQPIQEMSEKLYTKLDKEFPDFLKVDRVIIENQPSLRNPTMKTYASILYSYFVMRGIIDKNTTNSNIKEIRFVSPSNKLKVNSVNTEKTLSGKGKEEVYGLTKKLGIKYCLALINDDDAKIVNAVKKKDDMCDAFLQGFQHLFKPVPLKYFNKLQVIGFDSGKNKKTKKEKTKENSDDDSDDNAISPKKVNKNDSKKIIVGDDDDLDNSKSILSKKIKIKKQT